MDNIKGKEKEDFGKCCAPCASSKKGIFGAGFGSAAMLEAYLVKYLE